MRWTSAAVLALALVFLSSCSASSGEGADTAKAADDAPAPEAAASDICANIEREPSNQVAYEEFTRDFDREVRAGINETELSDALDATCGRLIAALSPPLETSERQALTEAEEVAERICVAMDAEESGDLAYLEFEMIALPELAAGLSEDELYDALTQECGDLISTVAPVFGSEPLMPGEGADTPGTEPPSASADNCPEDRPEGTEYLVCVDGVVVGMADGYCDISYDLFEWYGVAGNFNPYPVDVVMNFELVTDSGTRAGDGVATVWNLQPDSDSRFEVRGTSTLAEGSTCRIAEIDVTPAS